MYRAPTWLWASVDSEIKIPMYDHRASEVYVKMVRIGLDYQNRDNDGCLKGGSIKLPGPLRLALLLSQNDLVLHEQPTEVLKFDGPFSFEDIRQDVLGGAFGSSPQIDVRAIDFHLLGVKSTSTFNSVRDLAASQLVFVLPLGWFSVVGYWLHALFLVPT